MSDIQFLNAEEVGRAVGVPEERIVPPVPNVPLGPDGKPVTVLVQNWDGAALKRGIEYITKYKVPGTSISIGGHVDVWIILGLAYSLKPECDLFYAVPNREKPGTFDHMEFMNLPMGELNPDLHFDYDMRVEEDYVFMDYSVDDPGAAAVHTFRHEDLPDLVLPDIPPDKHLCLHAVGSYPVQTTVTNSYGAFARSVSTSCHDAPVYHCAISSCREIQPGDETPRKK